MNPHKWRKMIESPQVINQSPQLMKIEWIPTTTEKYFPHRKVTRNSSDFDLEFLILIRIFYDFDLEMGNGMESGRQVMEHVLFQTLECGLYCRQWGMLSHVDCQNGIRSITIVKLVYDPSLGKWGIFGLILLALRARKKWVENSEVT